MAAKSIFFACGGSGGHSYPLMAVAREFLSDPNLWQCSFVSTHGSIEEKIIPREGLKLHLISSGKIKGQSLFKTLISLFKICFSFFTSLMLIIREKPQFVFSAGGYAGAPFLVVAAVMGIPCGILEQNRFPGLANRWMAKFCKEIFVNFPETADYFKGKKVSIVGHPYRMELASAKREIGQEQIHLSSNPFHIFVFGGSQGAMGINTLVCKALPFLANKDIFIHHQTGQADWERVRANYADSHWKNSQIEPYVFDMTQAYRRSHLIICRAGASSLAELAATGKAAILIPLVSKDKHQEPNAFALANAGAANCQLQGELTGEKLAELVIRYYDNRDQLLAMSNNIRKFDHPDAAQKIAARIKEVLHA